VEFDSEVVEEGWRAYLGGLDRQDCPHAGRDRARWLVGWLRAEADFERSNATAGAVPPVRIKGLN
jgi:ribosome modulation factor